MLIKRTKEGLAAARRRGKRLGRPPKLTADHLETARAALADETHTIAALARRFEVKPWTLSRALKYRHPSGQVPAASVPAGPPSLP